MKTRVLIIIVIVVAGSGLYAISPAYALFTDSVLIQVEGDFKKMYYNEKNVNSVLFDPNSGSVIFKTGSDATLEIKAPKVYKKGPELFILKNGEEIAPETISDDCFYYVNIESKVPETIEIVFASWPEYPETVEDCETFAVPPLKQLKLGVAIEKIQCSDNLIVIQKYDDSPACIKPESAQKLVGRGWAFDESKACRNQMDCFDSGVSVDITSSEPEFLSKTATEWKSMSDKQLMDYHNDYHDNSFFSDLGSFLIKDEMKHEMEKYRIQNKYNDFTVYGELSLTSLPPHAGFSAVVNSTNQKTYLLGGSVVGNIIENVYLRELVFYDDVLNSVEGKNMNFPYYKLLKTEPQVSISQDGDHIRTDPHTEILDLEQGNSVVFHNDLEYLIRIEAHFSKDVNSTILKSGTVSPNQTRTITFENIGMYKYDVLGYPDNDSGLWEKKGGGEIIAISQETKNLSLEEKLDIARSFLDYARDDIPFSTIGIGNGELTVGIKHSVERSIPDYREYYERRIQQWIPFEVPIHVK